MKNPAGDPFDLKSWFKVSTVEKLEACAEYHLALKVHQGILDAWKYCHEMPRWGAWWDQVNRSSMSTAHNIAEAWGKSRGFFVSAYMIARGEAYECYCSLQIGPKEICETLKPLSKEMIAEMNETLANTPLDRLESMTKNL